MAAVALHSLLFYKYLLRTLFNLKKKKREKKLKKKTGNTKTTKLLNTLLHLEEPPLSG